LSASSPTRKTGLVTFPEIYVPHAQAPLPSMQFIVRTAVRLVRSPTRLLAGCEVEPRPGVR
jgi:hypothetical protein